jgi:DNA invertase Pin-like site-specific DNA recombinase
VRGVQFEHVLVYDVSRWGRFQDADESAYYEYTCKKANIRLHYCVEQFRNDGSPYSALLKPLKRTMAGKYSRELPVKVHAAQIRFAGRGFHQGGSAGYGLRRLLVDASGNAKRLLGLGQRKDLPTDRVLLVPGPAEEIAVVRKIFKWFTTERRSEEEIATILNQRKIKAERCKRWPEGPKWTKQRVHWILTSPRYIGTTVYNRTSNRLSEGTVFNPRDQWVCREGAVKPLVEPHVFQEAQNIIQRRSFRRDNYQILDQLSALLKRTGKISERIISKEKDLPCMAVIMKHFKSLLVVYEGYGLPRRSEPRPVHKPLQIGLPLAAERIHLRPFADFFRSLFRPHVNACHEFGFIDPCETKARVSLFQANFKKRFVSGHDFGPAVKAANDKVLSFLRACAIY